MGSKAVDYASRKWVEDNLFGIKAVASTYGKWAEDNLYGVKGCGLYVRKMGRG